MRPFSTEPYGDHPSQFIEMWAPTEPQGAVTADGATAVLIHGGYWRDRYGCDLMHPMATRLLQLGWSVMNLEYRRIGEVDDAWPAMAQDISTATALAPAGSVIIGHSAGGHLALWAAAKPACPELLGVVALAPLADLETADRLELSDHATRELFGPTAETRSRRIRLASPRHLLPIGVRQLVVHGDADVNVPQHISADYVAAATRAGDDVSYLDPAGVDHFQVINPETEVWAAIETVMSGWAQPPRGGPA